MSVTLTFRQTSATTADLEVSYPVGEFETGSEHYTYHAAKPENVIREGHTLSTKAGVIICTGIQLRNGLGYGVAWPL